MTSGEDSSAALPEAKGAAAAPAEATEEQVAGALPPAVRRTALAEITGFLALLVGIDVWLLDGGGYWQASPHPFWIIVVFVATQYGSREGLVAAGLSSVALFAGGIPEQRMSEDLYAWLFELSRRPLMWSVAAVMLGELRMRQVREREGLRQQVERARERAGAIAAAYESLNEIKSQLEVRVAGQLRTVVSMYEAARAVETMEPAQVLAGALDNVKAVINPRKCSIYLLSAGELEAAIQYGWGRRDRIKRQFRADSALFREVIGRARVVCVADPDDELVLDGQGLIAGPLVNPDTGEVRGMIKIEDMGFLDLNLSTIEIFRVLCEWVGAFYANAQRYRRGQIERALDSETQLYSASFYPRMEQLLIAIARRVGFPITAIGVSVDDPQSLETTQRLAIAGALGRAVADSLRDTDIAFYRDESDCEYDVVLPLTPLAHGDLVAGRLLDLFRSNLPEALRELPVSAQTRALHQADEVDDGDAAGR